MTTYDYDVTIIGGGSGGLTAARLAAALGARTLLIDKERLGGDCLNYGCVPSKALIHVAKVVHLAQSSANLGLLPEQVQVDMARVSAHVQQVIGRVAEAEKVYVEDVSVRFGQATFRSKKELDLNGERLLSKNFIIATGSRPQVPPIPGLQEVGYLTNEDVFDLQKLPPSLAIVGGGPVGVEMAQAFARLGSQVTLLQGPARLLPKEEPEVSEAIVRVLAREGIRIETAAPIYALGDVIGGYRFTHVAAYQAGVAVRNALVPFGRKKVDYTALPWVTFTDPEAARVGLTEEEARKKEKHLRVIRFPWRDIDRA